MSYKYLVAAALQEELNEFINLTGVASRRVSNDVEEVAIQVGGEKIEIALFCANRMGMPYNAAKLMKIILNINPKFTLFIGTCATVKDEYDLGSVLIPHKVFSYESGKYENGKFLPDFASIETSETLRRQAEMLWDNKKSLLDFKVITDEDFCSGSAVINDEEKKSQIKERGSRKVSGLDMEAYTVACINQILSGKNELLVVKGISDIASKKTESEKVNKKELAKSN